MYCSHCGKQIIDSSQFCQHCGGKQIEDQIKFTQEKEENNPAFAINTVFFNFLGQYKINSTFWGVRTYTRSARFYFSLVDNSNLPTRDSGIARLVLSDYEKEHYSDDWIARRNPFAESKFWNETFEFCPIINFTENDFKPISYINELNGTKKEHLALCYDRFNNPISMKYTGYLRFHVFIKTKQDKILYRSGNFESISHL